MKEEGEITDDDDDAQIAEMLVSEQLPEPVLNNNRKRGANDCDRDSVSSQDGVIQRSADSQKLRNHSSAIARNTTLRDSSPVPVKKTKRCLNESRLDLRASAPRIRSGFSPPQFRLSFPLRPSYSGSQHLRRQVTRTQSNSSDREFQKSDCSSAKSQPASSYEVTDTNGAEIIVINDSDFSDDVEVIDYVPKQEDEDLDELQLRRDALDSAFKSNVNKKKTCMSFGGDDSVSLLNSEKQNSEHIYTYPISSIPDVHHCSDTVHSIVDRNMHAADSSDVIMQFTTSNGCLYYSQLPFDRSQFLQQDYSALSALNQQNSGVPRHEFLPIDSTYMNSAGAVNQALPMYHDVQEPNVDNYDQVEMELDSGSNCDSPVASLSEQLPEGPSNYPDQNFNEHQAGLEASAIATDSLSLHEPVCNSPGQSVVLCPGGGNVVAENLISEDTVVAAVPGDKVLVPMHTKTKTVDSSSDNLQPQRKVRDADQKLELLLRAEVLRSLSSNRQQQQQQSQIETVPCRPRDRPEANKLQLLHSVKRTITQTSSSQLPVHQPVVISLTGESSDSSDEEQVIIAESSDQSNAAASSSLAGISDNLDRVLREIRRAAESPKSQNFDTAPSRSQAETVSSIKYQEKRSTPEPTLENEYILSNKASNLLPFSAHNTSLITNPVISCNKQIEDLAEFNVKDNSLKKTKLSDLQREVSFERRKLQQQKIALSKTNLKMARKKEQVGASEKRVKKLREQLAAAEKISASSKKQLSNLREETLTLLRGIEQRQKAVSRLEVELRIAEKNLVSFTNDSGCDSGNFLQSEILPVNSRPSVSSKWDNNAAGSTVSSADVTFQVSVSDSHLSASHAPQNSFGIELRNKTQSQMHDSARMALKAQTLHGPKRFRHLNTSGACKVESDRELVKDVFVKRELSPEAERNADVSGQSAKQQIVSHTDNAALPGSSVTKPHIFNIKSDASQLETDALSVVSDGVCNSHISSTFLDELTTLPCKKIKQILHNYNSSLDKNSSLSSLRQSCRLYSSDPMFSFHFPVNSTLSVSPSLLAADCKSDSFEIRASSYTPYHSSLLCFKSYRFSDLYQQRGLSVSTETFSHKLDCHIPLCQYDLMGKCLDEQCPWQHRSDYRLSSREHLVDIVSYCPAVVGIDNSTPVSKYDQLLNQYVDKFLKGACSQLAHSEQCNLLIEDVKAAASLVHLHAVCTSPRCWKLDRNKPSPTASERTDLLFSSYDICDISHESTARCLATDEVRYWMIAESDQIRNLEEAVTDIPSDDSSWIKLAYAKMTEKRGSASHDECVSYGLNVLTRAVEANPSNSNLWRHYLDLYMERSHAEKDISLLFEQAVQYAPSYEFFWKYLQLPVSYSQKMDICKRLRQYLCSPMCRDDADMRSHHLLETVLYQAALCTMSGRFKIGLQVLQAIVQSKASVIWLTLTLCDRIVMWLSFIHLYECRNLPEILFDPANSNPGPVVQKETFVIPFQVGTKTRISYETLLQLFQSAFSACDKGIKPGSGSSDEYLRWLSALYRSRILLELSCHGWFSACQLAEQFLQQRVYLVDVWLFLIQLIVAGTSQEQTVASVVSSTVDKAVSSNPHSVILFLAGVCALIECGQTDSALNFAEHCPINLFEVDEMDSSTVDPNLLYCCLLMQPLPPNYKVPALRPSVTRQFVSGEQANLWLCYCLLLDLQGAHDQATETYHLALSCLTRTKDIRRLWLAFLRRSAAVISHQLPWLSPGGSTFDEKRKLWQQFKSDTHRALASFPVRRSLPYSTEMWDDYTCHNEIICLYISCMPDAADLIQEVYERYLRQMPRNIGLALTTVSHLLNRDAVQSCNGLMLMVLHSCPRAALLWNLSLRLCQRTSNVGLVRSLYDKATKMLPFSASLWKTYIMFEVLNKSRGRVQELLDNCERLQVNIAGFIDTLLK